VLCLYCLSLSLSLSLSLLAWLYRMSCSQSKLFQLKCGSVTRLTVLSDHPRKFRHSAFRYAATYSLHIFSNSFYISHPTIRCQSELPETSQIERMLEVRMWQLRHS